MPIQALGALITNRTQRTWPTCTTTPRATVCNPDMFLAADLILLNKVDLLPHLSFDVARCVEYARRINPRLEVHEVSAVSGQGMEAWIDWLTAGLERARVARQENVDLLRRRIAELEAQLAAKA